MTLPIVTFVALTVACWIGAAFLWRTASGTDDFGAGALFWVLAALGVIFALVAAVLWPVNLYASGFR